MLPCLRTGMYRQAACVLNITSRMLVLHCADSYKKSGMHPLDFVIRICFVFRI